MSRLQTIGFVIMTLIVTTGCIGLGWWQLGRLAERRAANRVVAEALSLPRVNLNESRPAQLEQRRVIAAGRYDHTRTIVLRGRPYRGTPGVRVVTPLQLTGSDTAILVDRGFVPSADAVTVDLSALASPDSVTIVGPALPLPRKPDAARVVTYNGTTTWHLLELGAVENILPYPILPVWILQAPDSAMRGFPKALDPPPLRRRGT